MGNTSSGHMNIKYFGVLITNHLKMICVDNCAVCTPKETYYGENLRDVQMTLNGNSFRSYCTNLYCALLWCSYKGSTFSRVKVAVQQKF